MRSGSDGVELDRSTAALHTAHGPRTGPPPVRPCGRRTIGLVQRASRADGPVPSAEDPTPVVRVSTCLAYALEHALPCQCG
ncbi:hypothetical protein DI272_29215 [Streptomyces sp. Act143]|nr:hypothetical protein DI272_29215 [Streptomyces sp. Act143]